MEPNWRYNLFHPHALFLVNGVITIRPKSFILLNDYFNQYFSWRQKDDNMSLGLLSKEISIQRSTNNYNYPRSHLSQTRNKNQSKLSSDAALRRDIDELDATDK